MSIKFYTSEQIDVMNRDVMNRIDKLEETLNRVALTQSRENDEVFERIETLENIVGLQESDTILNLTAQVQNLRECVDKICVTFRGKSFENFEPRNLTEEPGSPELSEEEKARLKKRLERNVPLWDFYEQLNKVTAKSPETRKEAEALLLRIKTRVHPDLMPAEYSCNIEKEHNIIKPRFGDPKALDPSHRFEIATGVKLLDQDYFALLRNLITLASAEEEWE